MSSFLKSLLSSDAISSVSEDFQLESASESQTIRLDSPIDEADIVRVNFSYEGMDQLVSDVATTSTPSSSSIKAVSAVASNVEVVSSSPPSFRSIPELHGVDSVGYVIEKERLDRQTGNWIRVDNIKVIGSRANGFKDGKVAYGQSYRYRIRSVYKVTKRIEPDSNIDAASIDKNFNRGEIDEIKTSLGDASALLTSIDKITNIGISPTLSSGDSTITVPLTQDLSLESDAEGTRVVESTSTGGRGVGEATPTTSRGTGTVTGEEVVATRGTGFIDQDTAKYVSFYYVSSPSKNWMYVDTVENKPPPPPTAIKIQPSTPNKHIFVSWLKPANDQRDIVGYRLYRRNRVGQGWKVLKTFADRETLYIDKDVVVGEKYIYALTCIDVHGFESFLSTQIEARLNSNFASEKKEKLLRFVSGSGSRPDELSRVFKKFRKEEPPIVAQSNIVIGPTEDFGDTVKNLVIKVTSLDTHESKEFKITLKNLNIGEPNSV